MTDWFDSNASQYKETMGSLVAPFGTSHTTLVSKKVAICKQLCSENNMKIKRILDFGSGLGIALPFFQEYFPEAKIIATDISNEALAKSQEILGTQIDFRIITDTKIPVQSKSFDLVFASGVFHHISKKHRTYWLGEIKRVPRTGGLAVLFENNPYHPVTRWMVSRCPWDKDVDLLSMSETEDLFGRLGFCPIRSQYHLIFPPALPYSDH